ncbi:MAG: hypothetical protein U9R66_14285 [Thermodesulfobacteriota bacterium]|nr:hypothetical protein [Thermodesulfobacteriota bacterium]
MKKMTFLTLIASISLFCITPSMAGVGVTDSCQEEAKELSDKIRDNKDDYTAESRRKAKVELTAAKTNRLNPAKCRKNIVDARSELTKGKRDKKRKN